VFDSRDIVEVSCHWFGSIFALWLMLFWVVKLVPKGLD